MITGIDETGDFDPKSTQFNFFVAVHIDQNGNKLEIKRSQFNLWESSIPEKFKIKGEIKGQNIPDEYLETFFNEILNVEPKILYSVIRIVPAENSSEIVEKHKKFEVASMERLIDEVKKANHTSWIEGYTKILHWYKNKNYQTIMKMKCLEHLLGISLNRVLGWGQLSYIFDKEDISNLSKIEFKVDKDFVKAENVKVMWNELFRQFWQEFTKKDPLPIMDSIWKEKDHPYLKVFKSANGKSNMKNIFRKKTQFLDSNDSWEIRMADIVGTILHRYQNRGRCEVIGKKLMSKLGGKMKNYEHLILNDVK
jgi:hypothetical protein